MKFEQSASEMETIATYINTYIHGVNLIETHTINIHTNSYSITSMNSVNYQI